MKRPPRVVIDTNLVLSALVFAGGRLAPLRLAWQGQEELLADNLPYCKTVRILPRRRGHRPVGMHST